jgi:Na+-transporting NADH:ubiquinone oxidoreductase subunit A
LEVLKIIPARGLHIFICTSLSISSLSAQSTNSVGLVEISIFLLAAAVLLFAISLVADNLIGIEAKKSGVEEVDQFSFFPDLGKLTGKGQPEYISGHYTRLKKGYNIKLEGEAEKIIEVTQGNTFALQPSNFIGLAPIPKLNVQEGEEVKAGDVLFFDKKNSKIKFVAPVSGEIIAINRGLKRAISEIVILADKKQNYRSIPTFNLESEPREELVRFLLDFGGWPVIRP